MAEHHYGRQPVTTSITKFPDRADQLVAAAVEVRGENDNYAVSYRGTAEQAAEALRHAYQRICTLRDRLKGCEPKVTEERGRLLA